MSGSPDGLREQKKERTRQALLEAALTLFLKQGFAETTVEQIAAAADVAPRTFFRYFTSKEDVVFLGQDEENASVEALLRERPAGEDLLDSLVRGARLVIEGSMQNLAHVRRSTQLVQRTPALRARQLQLQSEVQEMLVRSLVGKKPSKAEAARVRLVVGAFMGAVSAAMNDWMAAGARGDPFGPLASVERLLRDGYRPGK
jgi:AcrR family transcriptional regulator